MLDAKLTLSEIAERLRAGGAVVREAPYFAPEGIVAWRPRPLEAAAPERRGATFDASEIQIIEAGVFVYPIGEAWELRVTQHGGPHWTTQVHELEGLVARVVSYWNAPSLPPRGAAWRSAE